MEKICGELGILKVILKYCDQTTVKIVRTLSKKIQERSRDYILKRFWISSSSATIDKNHWGDVFKGKSISNKTLWKKVLIAKDRKEIGERTTQFIYPAQMPLITCPICFDEFQWQQRGRSFCFCSNCLNSFCRDCIEKWGKACPHCKSDTILPQVCFC